MSQVNKLPKREEIPAELKWKLEHIYPDEQAWEEDYQWVKNAVSRAAEYKGRWAVCGAIAEGPRLLCPGC